MVTTSSDVSPGQRRGGALAPPRPAPDVRYFLKRAAVFAAIGILLYGAVYANAERLVYRYAQRNRFFQVRTTPDPRVDFVILGASHAAALDYQDMTARLEEMSGARVMNLAVVGGGVTVNRLVFDYFLERHQAGGLVYVLDSFAFYSRQWNEDRLTDTRLFVRAPFDSRLARVLLRDGAPPAVTLDYLSGFSKINNPDRFAPDTHADEGSRFTRTYRAIPQIDQQRLEYLYPRTISPDVTRRYLDQFEALIRDAAARGMTVLVVKPPIPARVYQQLPDEASFDARIQEILKRHRAAFHDFSRIGNDDARFYDTDHLNRDGVLNFFEQSLVPLLRQTR